MTALRVLGGALLAAPLIALIALMVRISGWRVTVVVWAITIATVGSVVSGAFLVAG